MGLYENDNLTDDVMNDVSSNEGLAEEGKEKKVGFFGRLKAGLTKTKCSLSSASRSRGKTPLFR